MGTGKDSDKLGKSTVTSHKERWQTERGRRETTTPLLNGRLPPKRNLRWRSIVTKDTNDPKGWPHPEGRQRRRNRVEGSPHNQAREEEPRLKDQHRPWRRSDSHADQRKPKPTASAWGSGTAQRPKANPTKLGKAMSRSWTEEEHRPYQRQVT